MTRSRGGCVRANLRRVQGCPRAYVTACLSGKQQSGSVSVSLPQRRDDFAQRPVLFGVQTAVHRHFNDGDVRELFSEHQSEGDEDAVVEAGASEPSPVVASGLVLRGRSGLIPSLTTCERCCMQGEKRTKTHILVQLNDALGKRRVTARLELDFIERRRESKVVHQ